MDARFIFAAAVAVVAWLSLPAWPHEAPTGWAYDIACCSNQDCRAVPERAVIESREGFTIAATGEFIPRNSTKVRRSRDGMIHWCSSLGRDDTNTICLYIPDRGF
jgi:hypothetical protein